MKEQNKIDHIPLGLLDRLKRILPFAKVVEEEIVCEETDLLAEVIPKLFEVMHKAAEKSCSYVKYGRWSCSWIWHALIITARMIGGPDYLNEIEEIDEELTKVIGEFERAVNVENLRIVKRNGKHSLYKFGFGDSAFSVTSCRLKGPRARRARPFDPTT